MKKLFTATGIAFRIWICTAFAFGLLVCFAGIMIETREPMQFLIFISLAAVVFSFPAFILLLIFIPLIRRLNLSWKGKTAVVLLLEFLITAAYGVLGAILRLLGLLFLNGEIRFSFAEEGIIIFGCLFSMAGISTLLLLRPLALYFEGDRLSNVSSGALLRSFFSETSKTTITMETVQQEQAPESQSNRILVKGLITAGLILLMLIPTLFIQNLITERETRQKEVVKEVSSKWATEQTIAGPYLVVPYTDSTINNEGSTIAVRRQLILLPEGLDVKGQLFPEERPRSIYKVLLYKSALQVNGSFKPAWPGDVNLSGIDYSNAKLCFNLSDYKGIEEKITINVNGKSYILQPGLPVDDFGNIGLSVPVTLSSELLDTGLDFNLKVRFKGSEKLHFLPLSANSSYAINSAWPSPSFDGNTLPGSRKVDDKGFSASWNFNQANLPFSQVFFHGIAHNARSLAFGVSLVQPADQYNKTMRSVKYAILIIGLSFALFFIIELMQRKPLHPLQYVLVGLALVIFYTLLLSISEYILFDYAYLTAAAATVLLITFYARSHFQSWKTAAIFCGLISALYGFIFILIRLEDTALLIGSIGLFVILALVMYASRKVNWYGGEVKDSV